MEYPIIKSRFGNYTLVETDHPSYKYLIRTEDVVEGMATRSRAFQIDPYCRGDLFISFSKYLHNKHWTDGQLEYFKELIDEVIDFRNKVLNYLDENKK